jgi:hypothetical protein
MVSYASLWQDGHFVWQIRHDSSQGAGHLEVRFVEQFNLLKQASCKGSNGCAHATMVPQHGHMSEVYAINAVETRLGDEILDFVKTGNSFRTMAHLRAQHPEPPVAPIALRSPMNS